MFVRAAYMVLLPAWLSWALCGLTVSKQEGTADFHKPFEGQVKINITHAVLFGGFTFNKYLMGLCIYPFGF